MKRLFFTLMVLLTLPSSAFAEEPTLEALCDDAAALIEHHTGQCAALAQSIDAMLDEHEDLLSESLPTLDLKGSTAGHCRKTVRAVVNDPESGRVRTAHLVCLVHPEIRAVIQRLRDFRESE